jgi:hypothetical protein
MDRGEKTTMFQLTDNAVLCDAPGREPEFVSDWVEVEALIYDGNGEQLRRVPVE